MNTSFKIPYLAHPHPCLADVNEVSLSDEDWLHGEYYTDIPTVEHMRHLMGPKSNAVRKDRSSVFFRSRQMQARNKLHLGIHDRAEEFSFADGQVRESDLLNIRKHFPLPLKVFRYETMRLSSTEILDLTSSHKQWPALHYRSELYVYFHVNKLIIEPGAQLVIHGNLLVFCCDEIIIDRKPSPNLFPGRPFDCQLSILGTKHFSVSRTKPRPAIDGLDGTNGANGITWHKATETPSLFGPPPTKTTSDADLTCTQNEQATCGQDGGDGKDGTAGASGGMTMLADIRIGKLTNFLPNSFRIFTQAGTGNNGGNGGNGGLSSNIFVQIPEGCRQYFDIKTHNSIGGKGGKAGISGKNGRHSITGTNTSEAIHKSKAFQGKDGRAREGAQVHFTILNQE
tara:strand:+ start:746 stop:1936 length:1191 start_codon:yes stop_codon:yes gene_type:complete